MSRQPASLQKQQNEGPSQDQASQVKQVEVTQQKQKSQTFFKGNSRLEDEEEQMMEITKNKSPDYTSKYKIIRSFAPCEFKLAELVEQLDEIDEYETLLKTCGLNLLRTKFLETQPLHRKLLGRFLAFNKSYATYMEMYHNLTEITAKIGEKRDQMRRKRQVFEALKQLLQKLVFSPEPLQLEQLDRINRWLEQKLNAIEGGNPDDLKKQQQQEKLAKQNMSASFDSSRRRTALPELKCKCGDVHYEDEDREQPMGTLSLKKVIEDSKFSRSLGTNYTTQSSKSHVFTGSLPNRHSSQAGAKPELSSLKQSTTTRRGLAPLSKGAGSLESKTQQQFKYQSYLNMPKAGYSGMGHHYVMMSKLTAQRETIPITSYLPVSQHDSSFEIDAILRKVRESSLEMRRHQNTLALAHAAKGRSMSKQETILLEKSDRSRLATNFQDLGIKKRVGIAEPKYKNKDEFLMAGETSDEDGGGHELADVTEELNGDDEQSRPTTKNSRQLQREINLQQASSVKQSQSLEPAKLYSTGRSESEFYHKPVAIQYVNLESQDLLCRVRDGLKLPIDEDPTHMHNYMHKRMANQAQASVNSKLLSGQIEKESKRLKIAKLRRYHQNLIGTKVFDKNTSYFGQKINGPVVGEKVKKKKVAEEGAAEAVSSDDEIINAVNQYHDAITLSVYDDKNIEKKNFQDQYYHTPSIKGELVQTRCSMIDEYSKKKASPERQSRLKKAIQPERFGRAVKTSAFGLKLVTQSGNISGLHVEEEDAVMLKLPKTTQLCNLRQLAVVDENLQSAIDTAAALEKKKNAPKRKSIDDKKKKPAKGGDGEAADASKQPKIEGNYSGQLKELIRSERFETRMEHMEEIARLQKRCHAEDLHISADLLQRSIFLPEDEIEHPDNLKNGRYPSIDKFLMANPFPKPTKKKGKKKK